MKKMELGKIAHTVKKYQIPITALVLLLVLGLLWLYPMQAVQVSLQLRGSNAFSDGEIMRVCFDVGEGFREEDSGYAAFSQGKLLLKVDPRFNKADSLRIGFEGTVGERTLTEIGIYSGAFTEDDYKIGEVRPEALLEATELHDISNVRMTEQGVMFEVTGQEPYFVLSKEGVSDFRNGVCNFWYFKAVLTLILFSIGLLTLFCMKYPGSVSGNESKRRIAIFFLGSFLVQSLFTWHVMQKVEEIPVFDSKKAVELTRGEGDTGFKINHLTNGLQHIYLKVKEIDAENPLVMQVNTIKITVVSEDGKTILLEEAVNKNDLAGKEAYEVVLNEHYDIESCFVSFTDLEGRDIGVIKISEQTAGRMIDRKPWILGFGLVCNLALMFIVLYEDIRWNKKMALIGMYTSFAGMSVFKMWVYRTYIHGFNDESYHVAYTAYLESVNKIIPIFSDMRALKINGDIASFAKVPAYNYLGHPPLYYHILRMAGALEQNESKFVLDLEKMRMFSGILGMIAILLILYIGYSRISKEKPYLHLFYATAILCIPMMVYHVSGVNNDTLSLLGCTIYFLGALRFTEDKRDYKTFFLIAGGLTVALLSKLTAGAILGLISVFYIAWDSIVHKSMKRFICKEFFATIPVYAVAVFYYIAIYIQMGSFMPRIKDMAKGGPYKPTFAVEFMERSELSLLEYIGRFINKFFTQWRGISSHISVGYSGSDDGIGMLVRIAVWFLPVLLFVGYGMVKKDGETTAVKTDSKGMFLKCSYLGIMATVLLQLVRGTINFFYNTGYLGSHQSRYYLCIAMFLVFGIIYALEQREKVIGKKLNGVLLMVAIYYMYSDFIYFLLNYTAYIGV